MGIRVQLKKVHPPAQMVEWNCLEKREKVTTMIILVIVLILLFGGGGGYYGHSRWGAGGGAGIGLGTVLLIFLAFYLMGGLR